MAVCFTCSALSRKGRLGLAAWHEMGNGAAEENLATSRGIPTTDGNTRPNSKPPVSAAPLVKSGSGTGSPRCRELRNSETGGAVCCRSDQALLSRLGVLRNKRAGGKTQGAPAVAAPGKLPRPHTRCGQQPSRRHEGAWPVPRVSCCKNPSAGTKTEQHRRQASGPLTQTRGVWPSPQGHQSIVC